MNLTDVLSSKVFVKEDGAINFQTPKTYLEPFIDVVGDKAQEWRIKTANQVVNAEESGEKNIAYPRIAIEADLGISQVQNGLPNFFSGTVGMLYALDMQKPIVKVYTGLNVRSCLNLTIFNAEHVFQQELLGNYREVYSRASSYMKSIEKREKEYQKIYNDLKVELNEEGLNELIGYLVRRGSKDKIGLTPITGAVKLLEAPGTNYSIYDADNKFHCTKWNVFNSITQVLSGNKDFTDVPTKTISLAKLFLN